MVSCCGMCMICLGVLFLAGGIGVMTVANSILIPATYVVANAVIDASRLIAVGNTGDTPSYGQKARAGGVRPTKSMGTTYYYLVSITNKADVLKGVKPIVEDVGPYAFSSYSRLFRVKRTASTKTVKTSSLTYYVYEKDYSCAGLKAPKATRTDLRKCSDWKTDTITTYNPVFQAVMKIAKASTMGEAFGACLLGAQGLAGTYTALLPNVGNSKATLSAALGMQKPDTNCCLGQSMFDAVKGTANALPIVPEFSCWTKRKACSDGAETPANGIPAFNKNSATLQGSVLDAAQSVAMFDFFTNSTKISTDCTGSGGFPELNAEIDRLNAAIPATTGALKTGVTASTQALKAFGKYGFTYGMFRALHTYILWAGIAGLDTSTAAAICSVNPYSGSVPGITGCTIMGDFLDYIINGMGRAMAFEAITIGGNLAAGNPSDAYITDLTAEQMLWTGYTSKLAKDLNLADQPGQNLITFGRGGADGGAGTQSATAQDKKWPSGISVSGGGASGPWDDIVQLGNSSDRNPGQKVQYEDAWYEKCGGVKVCAGGCTASTSSYGTMTYSYDKAGTKGKDLIGEYTARWGEKKHTGMCVPSVTGCPAGATWTTTAATYARELKVEGLKIGTVFSERNGFAPKAKQLYSKGMKAKIYAAGRPLDLVSSDLMDSPKDSNGKTDKFIEFRVADANVTTWLDSRDMEFGNCFYNVDPVDGKVEALQSAPHYAGCKTTTGTMMTSAGGAQFAQYKNTASDTAEKRATLYGSKITVAPLAGVAVGQDVKVGAYLVIRSKYLNALHPNMCTATDIPTLSWPASLTACATGVDYIVPFYWLHSDTEVTASTVGIFTGSKQLITGILGLFGLMATGAYGLIGVGALCFLGGCMSGGGDEVSAA